MTRPFDAVMNGLKEDLFRMGGRCEAILEKSLRSVWSRDAELAAEVRSDDLEIDRLEIAIDAGVLRALALQAPVAADLRLVIAIKMVAADLERVGDLARNIAKSGRRISELDSNLPLPTALNPLSVAARAALRDSLDAFSRGDTKLARAVLDGDDAIDAQQDEVVRELLLELKNHPEAASQEVDAIMVAKNLERVADHATNIAENVILVAEARNIKHASKLAGDAPR